MKATPTIGDGNIIGYEQAWGFIVDKKMQVQYEEIRRCHRLARRYNMKKY